MKKILIIVVVSIISSNLFAKEPCGLVGEIDERIVNCAEDSGIFKLVSRTFSGKEVWYDTYSNNLWSAFSSEVEIYKIEESEVKEIRGNIPGPWAFPGVQEYLELERHGGREVFFNKPVWGFEMVINSQGSDVTYYGNYNFRVYQGEFCDPSEDPYCWPLKLSHIFIMPYESKFSIRKQCGLNGSLTERLEDCASKDPYSTKTLAAVSAEDSVKLVTRTADSYEVWLDSRSGTLWSDHIFLQDSVNSIDFETSKEICRSGTHSFLGNLPVSWNLPSEEMLRSLNEAQSVLIYKNIYKGSMYGTYSWASSGKAFLNVFVSFLIEDFDSYMRFSPRCVAKLP